MNIQDHLPAKTIILCLTLFFCLAVGGCSRQQPEDLAAKRLEVVGTGACEGLLQQLATAFNQANPGVEVVIQPSIGSGGGITEVGEGRALLGRISRPLKEKELAYGLTYLEFARDSVVFAVSANVGVDSLTEGELAGIFAGRISSWQQVGGDNYPINLFVREPGESSWQVVVDNLPAFKAMAHLESGKIQYHDSEMVSKLETYRNSIGVLTGSSLSGKKIKALAIDKVTPTPDNIISGRYRLSSVYALIFKNKNLPGLPAKFIDFIYSKTGHGIISANNMVPFKRK